MIGEHLVEQALEDDPTVLDRALETHTEHALTVLTRLAKRRPDAIRWLEHAFANDLERLTEPAIKVATESGDPIGQVLARVLEQRPLEDPSRFEALVPYPTTALREVGAAVLEQMMQTVLLTPQPWSEYVKSEVARISNNLVGRLSDLNRHEEALATARQALAVYRELAATRPEEFQPEVARSLDNMASVLSALGRHDEALSAAEEAAARYRELADRADAFLPDLARSLSNSATNKSPEAEGKRPSQPLRRL